MTTALLAIAVAATPLAVVAGMLRLADRRQLRRDARYARQIELTDAIHRAMGAATAPTVEQRRGGGWLVRMMVPLDRPAVVAEILRVTDQVFTRPDANDPLQIVLTARAPSRAAVARPSPSARCRPVRSTASMMAASR